MIDSLDVPPQEINLLHCCKEALVLAKSGECEVVTTYRDPYHVGISWANRGRIKTSIDVWFRQWEYLGKIMPLAKIYPVNTLKGRLNQSIDKLGLYEALDKDLDLYYEYIPKKWIDFAIKMIKPYR